MAAKRILLVDDYPDALDIWSLYLRSAGYDVDTAADGLDAVDHAHRDHPDAIILDLELPGITGYEAAVRLRSANDTCDIPLIAATGYSHVAKIDEARRCGFDAIVLKPCEPATLAAEIERVLESHRRDVAGAINDDTLRPNERETPGNLAATVEADSPEEVTARSVNPAQLVHTHEAHAADEVDTVGESQGGTRDVSR